jgi:hypothetical protein
MGLDETWNKWGTDGSRSPRGIRGYQLRGGTFETWKVQGKLGGYDGFEKCVTTLRDPYHFFLDIQTRLEVSSMKVAFSLSDAVGT